MTHYDSPTKYDSHDYYESPNMTHLRDENEDLKEENRELKEALDSSINELVRRVS